MVIADEGRGPMKVHETLVVPRLFTELHWNMVCVDVEADAAANRIWIYAVETLSERFPERHNSYVLAYSYPDLEFLGEAGPLERRTEHAGIVLDSEAGEMLVFHERLSRFSLPGLDPIATTAKVDNQRPYLGEDGLLYSTRGSVRYSRDGQWIEEPPVVRLQAEPYVSMFGDPVREEAGSREPPWIGPVHSAGRRTLFALGDCEDRGTGQCGLIVYDWPSDRFLAPFVPTHLPGLDDLVKYDTSWRPRIQLSADGRLVLVPLRHDSARSNPGAEPWPLGEAETGLLVFDAASGRQVTAIQEVEGELLGTSPNAEVIYVDAWTELGVVDASLGELAAAYGSQTRPTGQAGVAFLEPAVGLDEDRARPLSDPPPFAPSAFFRQHPRYPHCLEPKRPLPSLEPTQAFHFWNRYPKFFDFDGDGEEELILSGNICAGSGRANAVYRVGGPDHLTELRIDRPRKTDLDLAPHVSMLFVTPEGELAEIFKENVLYQTGSVVYYEWSDDRFVVSRIESESFTTPLEWRFDAFR